MDWRVLVCGGRNFANDALIDETLSAINEDDDRIIEVIHGAARRWDKEQRRYVGADYLAGEWARQRGIAVREFPAEWQRYGNGAGPIRNRHMFMQGRPNLVVAFAGGKGTADMMNVARELGGFTFEPLGEGIAIGACVVGENESIH